MSRVLEKIESSVQKVVLQKNCLLYDLELVGGGSPILRVYIDREGEKGVSIDDCSQVSKALSLLLDLENPLPGVRYHLEVSSPGLERPLRKKWHFEQAQGERISVQLKNSLGSFLKGVPDSEVKRKKLRGVLLRCEDKGIGLSTDLKGLLELSLDYDQIHRARVCFNFEF